MTHRSAATLCLAMLLCATALALRLPGLAQRPMHTDEAVQAVRFNDFLAHQYRYDPADYHGPALYVFAWPIALLEGRTALPLMTETQLRLVPTLLGAATILLLFLLTDALGLPVVAMAATFLAVSPAFNYYNRYFIHESLLVFLTVATLASIWRYRQNPRLGWALVTGAAFGLLYATKTTWIIAMACGLLAWALAARWQRMAPANLVWPKPARSPKAWHWIAASGAAIVVIVLLFSDFFAWPRGIVDSVLAFQSYLGRGLGQTGDSAGHMHPWYYYLRLLLYDHSPRTPIWSQAFPAALAVVGAAAAWRGGVRGVHLGVLRFVTILAVLLWVVYSAIPYKTPWLILTPLLPMAILAGVGVLVLWRYFFRGHMRLVLAALICTGVANLEWQSYAADFRFSSSPVNPYVYGHTSTAIFALVDRIRDITAVAPDRSTTLIDVISPDYWPLPWYLRGYTNVRARTALPQPSAAGDVPLIIVSADLSPALDRTLHAHYVRESYGLRPGLNVTLYTREDLWNRLLSSRGVAPEPERASTTAAGRTQP